MGFVGWIGLGKLGLPCALTMADGGHDVFGTDVSSEVKHHVLGHSIPYEEAGVNTMFERGAKIHWCDSIADVLKEVSIVFVAVQTPHAPLYEGVDRTPTVFKDFDYTTLEGVAKAITASATKPVTVVIVSTVLPGTMRRVVLPYEKKNPHVQFVYSPAFIAMGTAAKDWKEPTICIAGSDHPSALAELESCFWFVHKTPLTRMSIESAEALKVLYNTFIGFKIIYANTIMEIAHKTGADCDEITDALAKATDRIISARYLRGGMGDGGGCHPRDNLALAWLAERLELSVNPFKWLMEARDAQAMWIGQLAEQLSEINNLPIKVLGKSFKKDSTITTGSASRLMVNLMNWREAFVTAPDYPAVYIIGVNHSRYPDLKFPRGSIVIDPWRVIPDQDGVNVIRIGSKR